MALQSQLFEVTNLSPTGHRAFYTAAGRLVTLRPGESRVLRLTPSTANRLGGKTVRVVSRGGAVDPAADEGKAPLDANPVAIEALLARIDAGTISWPDLRKEADVFLDPTPASKADIIEALKAKAEELRAQ